MLKEKKNNVNKRKTTGFSFALFILLKEKGNITQIKECECPFYGVVFLKWRIIKSHQLI